MRREKRVFTYVTCTANLITLKVSLRSERLFASFLLPVALFCDQTFYYLLTNWLAYLYGRIQSPRPDVMPDRREGITRAVGFVFACIDTQTS